MTTQEFSNEFDTLLNSYYSQITPGEQFSKADLVLDEYEKSVLLTQAQEDIVLRLYNGTLLGEYFESTEISKRYLDSLIQSGLLLRNNLVIPAGINSYTYNLPTDLWLILYEQLTIDSNIVEVVPVKYDSLHRIKKNPFKGPNNKRAIRLDYGNNTVEIIAEKEPSAYSITYLRRPDPIILETFTDDNLTINGKKESQTCLLHESLHRLILERAVQLAISRVSKASK